jgi:hypothetical protein
VVGQNRIYRVGQNGIYAPYMIVYLVISLPKIPYKHRTYMVLANPTYIQLVYDCIFSKFPAKITECVYTP